jgi:hypothetical protein
MTKPLTKEEREQLTGIAKSLVLSPDSRLSGLAAAVLLYDAKLAALEAEVARLTPLAATGEAVEGMGIHDVLRRIRKDTWHVYTNAEGNMVCDAVSEGPTALAALRAAEGGGDEPSESVRL